MRLAAMFEAIAPYLEGRAGHDETVTTLYGAAAASPATAIDAERLAIYARFCRAHRFAVVELFEETRAAVIALAGEPAWQELVEDYFRAHPMRHFELSENGAALPAWLTEVAGSRSLPTWLAELADLEWWSFWSEVTLDDALAEAQAPESPEAVNPDGLRIASTVELRRYAHDLLAWLDEAGAHDLRTAAPPARDTFVLFWRDRDLEGRREGATPVELLVLKMVSEGLPRAALAEAAGLRLETIDRTVADLRRAGILEGP